MTNEPSPAIHITLATRRQQLGMSQDEVAALAGVTQKTLSTMERGVADPRLSTLQGAARVLGMDLRAIPRELLPYVDDLLRPLTGEGISAREEARPLYSLEHDEGDDPTAHMQGD